MHIAGVWGKSLPNQCKVSVLMSVSGDGERAGRRSSPTTQILLQGCSTRPTGPYTITNKLLCL